MDDAYGGDIKPLLSEVDAGTEEFLLQNACHLKVDSEPAAPKSVSSEDGMEMCEISRDQRIISSTVSDASVQNNFQQQLTRIQSDFRLTESERIKFDEFRDRVGEEVHDLTAQLFEEATAMVNAEKAKSHRAEKELKEAKMKLEGLLMESALRQELDSPSKQVQPSRSASLHLMTTPDIAFRPKSSISEDMTNMVQWIRGRPALPPSLENKIVETSPGGDALVRKEMDPIVHREFVAWRTQPSLDRQHLLMERIYTQDILPAFEFGNTELAGRALQAVKENTISIEEGSKYKPFSKMCSLTLAPRLCFFRMKLGEDPTWYPISLFARNRVTTVCDFFAFVRYIQQGLVRRGVHDTWWEIVHHREKMSLARLGLL